MYQGQLRTVVAAIILVGHTTILLCGFGLGLFGPLRGTDLVQVILTASPVLAATAALAFRYSLRTQTEVEQGLKITGLFGTVAIATPLTLIACILLLFWAMYRQVNGFGPNELKIGLGAVETFFGAFLGLVAEELFGPLSPKRSRRF